MKNAGNTFEGGINKDVSRHLLKNNMLSDALNVRIINISGSSYSISNLDGTQEAFEITEGYVPVASKSYNGIAYILSYSQTNADYEIGTYPSPGYEEENVNFNTGTYRPLNNLIPSGSNIMNPFRYPFPFNSNIGIELQQDYDNSINIIISSKGNRPVIINSGFSYVGEIFSITAGQRAGGANTNVYEYDAVQKETSLFVSSDKILEVDFGAIERGGILKPGNYIYYFSYMTEDFNETEVVNQSSVCSVFFGDTVKTIRGGNFDTATGKSVRLSLSNLDTGFRYIKVYFSYFTGSESLQMQTLEMTVPVTITGAAMNFVHTGYEEVREISRDKLNLSFSSIDTANTAVAVQGYLMLGGIKTKERDFTAFRSHAQSITHSFVNREFIVSDNTTYGFQKPENIYNYAGLFDGETYPFAINYIFKDGYISPAFPVAGYDHVNGTDAGGIKEKGLIRLPNTTSTNWFFSENKIRSRGIRFTIPLPSATIREQTMGYFITRADRQADLVSQGCIIPTYKVPIHNTTHEYQKTARNYDTYKLFPHVDGLLEAFQHIREGGTGNFPDDGELTKYVTNNLNDLYNGFLPIFVHNREGLSTATEDWLMPIDKWAYLSNGLLCNTPEEITKLDAVSLKLKVIGQAMSQVKGQLPNSKLAVPPSSGGIGFIYDHKDILNYVTPPTADATVDYIPEGTGLSINGFTASFSCRILFKLHATEEQPFHDGIIEYPRPIYSYHTAMQANDYFGLTLSNRVGNFSSPIPNRAKDGGENLYVNGPFSADQEANYNEERVSGFIVNLYNGGQISDINTLYPSTDNLSYYQVSKRYSWSAATVTRDVYNGDCFTGKIYRKLHQRGDRQRKFPLDRANIDMGVLVSFVTQSTINPYLRQPHVYDVSEIEERSFYPLISDIDKIREYRYPETALNSPGYSRLKPEISYFQAPSNAPFIQSNFYSRVYHSEKHVPNSYKNGYRAFTGMNFQDYDASMGSIIRGFNFNDNLFLVFEHGMGMVPINQRIQTGSDVAGSIFVEPKQVLSPNMGVVSKEYGGQDFKAMCQTPMGIYICDRANRKFLFFGGQGPKIISDGILASFLTGEDLSQMVVHSDRKFHEVLFTTPSWTLCYNELTQTFTSFYSFLPSFYLSINDRMYSYFNSRFHLHNVADKRIYGNQQECFVEFVVNADFAMSKVFDYVNILSNNVAPKSITFTNYNHDGTINQRTEVINEYNIFLEEETIKYRDKKFVSQIPKTLESDYKLVNWGSESRMRDKYIVVRLTYDTLHNIELSGFITFYRYSAS